jgi:hypothetical protein
MKKRLNDHQGELEDIREILGVIVERMVAKDDFVAFKKKLDKISARCEMI